MAKDLSLVIRSLQCSAVNRCRERLDAAALKSRDLISTGETENGGVAKHDTPEYGVTSLLKRRHGL